jgi:hypothetical protein
MPFVPWVHELVATRPRRALDAHESCALDRDAAIETAAGPVAASLVQAAKMRWPDLSALGRSSRSAGS